MELLYQTPAWGLESGDIFEYAGSMYRADVVSDLGDSIRIAPECLDLEGYDEIFLDPDEIINVLGY